MIETQNDITGTDTPRVPAPTEQNGASHDSGKRSGESRQSAEDSAVGGEREPASEQRGRMPSRHDERAYRTYRSW